MKTIPSSSTDDWFDDQTEERTFFPPNTPCIKRVYKEKTRLSIGLQPGTKNSRGPVDKSVVTWFLDSIYTGFRLFVPPEKRPGWLSSVPWKIKWKAVSWPHQPAAVPLRLAAPPRPASLCPARPAAERQPVPPRPWFVQVLDSTDGQTKIESRPRSSNRS